MLSAWWINRRDEQPTASILNLSFIKKAMRLIIMSEELIEESRRAKDTGVPIPVRVRTTTQQVAGTGLMEMAANVSGKIAGYGLGKLANLVAEFTSGFELGMIAGRQPSQRERQIQHQLAQEDVRAIAIEE